MILGDRNDHIETGLRRTYHRRWNFGEPENTVDGEEFFRHCPLLNDLPTSIIFTATSDKASRARHSGWSYCKIGLIRDPQINRKMNPVIFFVVSQYSIMLTIEQVAKGVYPLVVQHLDNVRMFHPAVLQGFPENSNNTHNLLLKFEYPITVKYWLVTCN